MGKGVDRVKAAFGIGKAADDAGTDVPFEQRETAVREALRNLLKGQGKDPWDTYTIETYDDHVIVCVGDDYILVPYAVNQNPLGDGDGDADDITFDWANAYEVERGPWQKVTGDTEGAGDLVALSLEVPIAKVDNDRGMVFGWANVPIGKDGAEVVDSQGDIMDLESLESTAYDFMLEFGVADDTHDESVVGRVVESMVFTDEKFRALATVGGSVDEDVYATLKSSLPQGWWVGFKVDDEAVLAKTRPGADGSAPVYRSFSVGGLGTREAVDA